MPLNRDALFHIYFVCGLVVGVWLLIFKFRGGRNSIFYKNIRAKLPGVDAANPWVLYAAAAFGVVFSVILWPWALIQHLRDLRRRNALSQPLYFHPKLKKLRSALTGNEENYADILAKFGLDEVVTALHAIDLDAAAEFGVAAAQERHAKGDPDFPGKKKPTLEDFGEATYANVVKFAVLDQEYNALLGTQNKANLHKAFELRKEFLPRYSHIRNPGYFVGDLMMWRLHRWAPESALTNAKTKYAQHLKPGFNNADHMAATFGGIRVVLDRNLNVVAHKDADMTVEQHNAVVAEKRAHRKQSPDPKHNPEAPRTDDVTS